MQGLSEGIIEKPDIYIRECAIPRTVSSSLVLSEGAIYGNLLHFRSFEKGILLTIQNVGKIWIDDTGEVLLEPIPEADVSEMRFYILGAALGLFLIRKGAFPIHGSTVANHAGCCMFCGSSGAGKSTLSAWLIDHGYRLLAEDVSLVHFSKEEIPKVWPGISHIKLWDDSALALNRNPETLPYLINNWEKRYLTAGSSVLSESAPLSAIFLLLPENCSEPRIRLLSGVEKFAAIAGNIYRGESIPALGQIANHFDFSTRLASCVQVYALTRPQNHFALKEIHKLVENTLNNLYEAGTPV